MKKSSKYSAKDIVVCPHPHRHQLSDGSIVQLWQVETKSLIKPISAPDKQDLEQKIRTNAFENTKTSTFLSLDDFDVSLFKVGEKQLEILIRHKYGEYNEDFSYTSNVFEQVDKLISEIINIQGMNRENWIFFRVRKSPK